MQFGVSIGPQANDIAGVRERVLAAERAGFDFVSIQDHPYVAAYVDTFSLIANLAATTSRLRFIANVANLPLCPAPMLAKAAAVSEAIDTLQAAWGFEANDAVNFVLEDESNEQILRFGTEVVAAARETLSTVPADRARP